MKKFIAILLAASLGFTATASAKQDDAKKNKNKSGPPQQHQQNVNVNAGPKNKMKVQHTGPKKDAETRVVEREQLEAAKPKVRRNVPNPNPNSALVNPAKIQKKQLHEQEKALRKDQKTIVNPQNIQQLRAKYKNFKATRSSSIASVQFNQNYRIQNSQNWSGPQYRVFQNYRPQWHDRSWWTSRYRTNIVLIGGGYYYWNSGYWYPAWGYDNAYSYYPYDGPIYVGNNRVPFDRVLGTVQASLQEQGYYRGEVDGLMGPLTREALANYQRDHGLISTAALDQPTLASLGLG